MVAKREIPIFLIMLIILNFNPGQLLYSLVCILKIEWKNQNQWYLHLMAELDFDLD